MSDNMDEMLPMIPPPQKECLSDTDKHSLDLMKLRRMLAVSNAEKALAQNELTESTYNNMILQLTLKYNLTDKDVITEQGEILRNAATQESK